MEEFGVKVRNLKLIKNKKLKYYNEESEVKDNPSVMKYRQKYAGSNCYTFVGKFDGYDKSLWKNQHDSCKVIEVSIQNAIDFFENHLKEEIETRNNIKDKYHFEESKYALEILKILKNTI